MANSEFKINELDDFAKQMLNLAEKKMPQECKSFLKKEAEKLRKNTINKAKATVKKKTGNYLKGFKRGKKVYEYENVRYNIRVYNNSPHAHLIEYGHVTQKNGKEGFVKGKNILENSSKEFKNEFSNDLDKFVDKVLDKGLQ